MSPFIHLLIIVITILGSAASPVSAGLPVPSIALYAGYGVSDFEDGFPLGYLDHDRSGYVPGGVQLLWNVHPLTVVGFDFSLAMVPFIWDDKDSPATEKITQTVVGARLRYELMRSVFSPHLSAGGGLYFGEWVIDYDENAGYADHSIDYDTAVGFDLGAGLTVHVDSERVLFVELLHARVNRTLDTVSARSYSYPHWSVRLGIAGPPW